MLLALHRCHELKGGVGRGRGGSDAPRVGLSAKKGGGGATAAIKPRNKMIAFANKFVKIFASVDSSQEQIDKVVATRVGGEAGGEVLKESQEV